MNSQVETLVSPEQIEQQIISEILHHHQVGEPDERYEKAEVINLTYGGCRMMSIKKQTKQKRTSN